MATDLDGLRAHLGVDDRAGLDLSETITPRTFAAPSQAPPPSRGPATFPSLPHISLAMPGALRNDGGSTAPSRTADLDVTGVLGEGGMGRVLLARQRSLRRDVAVKVLKAEVE